MMDEKERLEKLVDDLLGALDEDARQLEATLSYLDQLRGFVIKRDESSLRALLETIEAERKFYTANESKRQRIRQELAVVLGCSREEMNLSRLELSVPPSRQRAVSEKKTRLRALAEKLRTEYLRTTMLLSECVRLNRLMLKGIFGAGCDRIGITYTADGNAKWQMDRSIVSAKI